MMLQKATNERSKVLQLVLLSLSMALVAAAAPEPPREKFLASFAPFDGGPVSISPDGQHLAYAKREKGEAAVYVTSIAGGEVSFRAVIGKEDRKQLVGDTSLTDPLRVTFLQWADNEHVVVATNYNHIFSLNYPRKMGRHLVDFSGEERLLGPEFGMLAGQVAIGGRRNGRVIALKRGQPAEAVIEATTFVGDGKASHVLFQVDVDTGKSQTVFDEEVRGRLFYDSTGRVRGRYISGYTPAPVFVYKPELGKNQWQSLYDLHPTTSTPTPLSAAATYFGERAFPLAIEGDVLFFASSVGRNTLGIYMMSLSTGDRLPIAIEDPVVDLANPRALPGRDNVMVDHVTQKVVGVRIQAMSASNYWLDPELAAVFESVKARTRGYTVELLEWDDARERFVIEIHNRVNPGGYYLYTRATQQLELLLPQRTPATSLVKVQSTTWSLSRPDGGRLSGWLALPEWAEKKSLPLVVRLNPAPWARPFHGYNRDVMAFAQMGFAVLDLYPRGSEGFGISHLQAGRQRFDEVTAADILAAIDGLPPSAGVDKDRVALFGQDYGGYLMLRALQLRPERFACAVTIQPRVELTGLLQIRYPDSAHEQFEHALRVWYFGTDKQRLHEQAAASHPEKIRVPLFIAGNPNGYRGGWSELMSFRKKLTAARNPPKFVEVTTGAFVYGREQARLWADIEDFLHEHLAAK
jgi:dienelactone hydrolase